MDHTSRSNFAMPVLDAIKHHMNYANQRQVVLSQNIANADTPNRKALELSPPKGNFHKNLKIAVTSPGHMLPKNGQSGFKVIKDRQAYEMTPVGNNIVLEEQMLKASENNMNYQLATTQYKKMMAMLRTAGSGAR